MSRAVRRQQAATPKERPARKQQPPRLTAGARAPTRGARPAAQPRRVVRAPGWIQDIWSELKKVTWPSWNETRYLSQVVIFVAIAVGLALGLIDVFFNWLIDRLLLQ